MKKKQTKKELAASEQFSYGMESGARLAIDYLAKDGAFNDDYISWAIQQLIKNDFKDGLKKKIFDY